MSKKFAARVDLIRQQKTKQYGTMTLDLSIARSNEEIGIQGNMIYTESLSLDATAYLRLNEISADLVLMKIFRKITGCFYRIFLTNTAQAGKTITFYFSTSENEIHNDFSIEDYYLAVGSRLAVVDNILNITQDDSEFFETENKNCFIGSAHHIAVAAKTITSQLFNPAGSGVNGYLESIIFKTGTYVVGETPMFIGYSTAAYSLATEIVLGNKYLGEALGSLRMYHETISGIPPHTKIAYAFFVESYGAGRESILTFKNPILIPPGKGFVFGLIKVNVYLDITYQWCEKLI